MKIENKLALVWRDGDTNIAFPLDKVNTNLYKKLTKVFGSPVGRIEAFVNSTQNLDQNKYWNVIK